MRVQYKGELELPRWVGHALLAVAVPGAVFLGARLVARADTTTIPNTLQDGNTLTARQLNDNFAAVTEALNNANTDCPRGYTRVTNEAGFPVGAVLCRKGADDVVKVGEGASAFWADRFEASVWDNFAATSPSQPYGTANDNYPSTFPDTGQWSVKLYAVSKSGFVPSMYLTWFQANAACRASGKRLLTGSEWLSMAKGTPDDPGKCNTTGSVVRATNAAGACVSDWGAQDAIGNVAERNDEWYAGLGDASMSATPWPASGVSGDYGGDGTWGIASKAYPGTSGPVTGLPAPAVRGSDNTYGTASGIFALYVAASPSYWSAGTGFRCVVASR